MAFFLFPSPGQPASIAQSFGQTQPEPQNPTMLPRNELARFRFTFLIRHPRLSIPSYYRLSLPQHSSLSKVRNFSTSDLGYSELRRLFDYLRSEELIGPGIADPSRKDPTGRGRTGNLPSDNRGGEICLVEAECLLERPEAVVAAYCQVTGVVYEPEMLRWEECHDQERAKGIINRWGVDIYFHKAALESKTIQHSAQVSFFCPPSYSYKQTFLFPC
jgi:hypothetical protein